MRGRRRRDADEIEAWLDAMHVLARGIYSRGRGYMVLSLDGLVPISVTGGT